MLMSSGGCAASSSGCVTRPRAREIGSTGYAGPTQHSLLIGRYVMATAEHREPCDWERPEVKFLRATRQSLPFDDVRDVSASPSTAAEPVHRGEWTGY